MFPLILRSATYHWRTNLAVVLGVATAVSVFAGALLVGDSVRGSLRDLAVGRLGAAEQVVSSGGFFREELAAELQQRVDGSSVAPLVVATGFVTHEASGRRAGGVAIYSVDERFWRFHGLEPAQGVTMSPGLAAEFGASADDVLLIRLQRPSEVPIESLFGRKDDVGRTIRVTLGAVQPHERLGEFSLQPQQADVRAIFAPMRRIQRDLGVEGQVNTLLVAGGTDVDARLRSVLALEDLGATVTTASEPPALVLEGPSGIIGTELESAALKAGEGLGARPVPVFTYLANTIRRGDREVPYSLITAVDLEVVDGGVRVPSEATETVRLKADTTTAPIVLNDWTARELDAKPGDAIEVDYYLWDPVQGLTTQTAAFTLERIVPIAGFAADRRLAPEYPGITESDSLADWDPPFPIDLQRVRPIDEQYWDEYRTTPKAFIPYERGRELWETRYGGATSIRFVPPAGANLDELAARLRTDLLASVQPAAMGVAVIPARESALAASQGATDFGQYFTYFSFFLMVSALLLAVLFFRLGVEQRLRQIGVLRAAGFTIAMIRKLLLVEALAPVASRSIVFPARGDARAVHRLGGPLRLPVLAGRAAEPAGAGAEHGGGARGGDGRVRGSLPGRPPAVDRNSGARAEAERAPAGDRRVHEGPLAPERRPPLAARPAPAHPPGGRGRPAPVKRHMDAAGPVTRRRVPRAVQRAGAFRTAPTGITTGSRTTCGGDISISA